MPTIRENVYTDIIVEIEVFKEINGQKLEMGIFKPEDWNASDKRPAIIFYFGGGFYKGDMSHFRMQAEYFAHLGMVCFTPNYRLTTQSNVTILDCVRDAKAALRFVHHEATRLGIDTTKIVVSGGSAGGAQASSMVLVTSLDEENESSIPCAMVLFNPGLDFGSEHMKALPVGTKININGKIETIEDMMGNSNMMNDPKLREYSPRNFIRENLPDALIITGEADIAIPIEIVSSFKETYENFGNVCELVTYPNRNHGFFNWNSSENNVCFYDTLNVMESFLRKKQILNPGLRSRY